MIEKIFLANQKGFSLIELVIASAVLIVLILSLETVYINTMQTTQKNKIKNQAQVLARKTMEEYKALDFEKLKDIDGSATDEQINQIPGTDFNQQISVDFVDQDWADKDSDGDQSELVKTDNETNIMKIRIVISDNKTPKRINDVTLESIVSEGGHSNLPQFKITAVPEITNEGNVTITALASEALDPSAASGNPISVTVLYPDGTNSGNIYVSGGFAPTGTPNEWIGTYTVVDDGNPTHNPGDTVEGNATITVIGRNMPGQPVGLFGIEKSGILIDTYDPTYSNLIPSTGSSLGDRRPLISVIFKDEGNPSFAGPSTPNPSLLDPATLIITINGSPLSGLELDNVSKITQNTDSSLNEYELKVNYTPPQDLADGPYAVNLTISDFAGNITTALTNFTITGPSAPDNVKPVIIAQTPVHAVSGLISTVAVTPAIITDLRPTITAILEDHPHVSAGCTCLTEGASGIDPSTIVLKLDGAIVSHNYAVGQVSFIPSSDLNLEYVYELTLDVNDNGLDFTDDLGTGGPDGDKYDSADNIYETAYNVDINGDGVLGVLNGVWEQPNSADQSKWYFKVTSHPVITSVKQLDNEINVSLDAKIEVNFSKAMNIQSVKDSISVIGSTSGDITASVLLQITQVSNGDKTFKFNENRANIFYDNEIYTVTINNTALDTDGLDLAASYTWSFSTPDTIPPVFWHNDHNPPPDGQISGQPVIIRVRAKDNIFLPQNKVYLYYQNKIAGGVWSGWYNNIMTFLSWNVTDLDGEFTYSIDTTYITIPAGYAEGELEYYFKAFDSAGNVSYFDKVSVDGNFTSSPGTPYMFTIGPPPFMFFDDFDGGIAGDYTGSWSHGRNRGSDDWEVGYPYGKGGTYRGNPDPLNAHSGTNCYGNDLTGLGSNDGDYEPNSRNYLKSPTVDCTGKTNVYLTFYRWLNVDKSGRDKAQIHINSGSGWKKIFQNSSSAPTTDSSWTLQTIDISSWADNKASVRIRFRLRTNGSLHYSGWNIDDVTIKEGP